MKRKVKDISEKKENIRSLMIGKGWNQAELSRQSGVSIGTLSKFFNGRDMSGENYSRVLKALKPTETQNPIPSAPNDYTHLLVKLIEEQSKRIDDLSAQLQHAVSERKTDIDRIDKRHAEVMARVDDRLDKQAANLHQKEARIAELDHQLGETQSSLLRVTTALIQTEKQKDFLPLKILSGRK